MKQKEWPQAALPPAGPEGARPPEVANLLDRVGSLLHAGQPRQAFDLLAEARSGSPWAATATAVCLLRLGQAGRAVELLRGRVLGAGGVCLRDDVPVVFKINFATALLAAGNLAGGQRVLDEIREEPNPAVQKLRAALRRWRDGLSFWQKLRWSLGGEPSSPLVLDEALGEL